jgi:hypothetical protein
MAAEQIREGLGPDGNWCIDIHQKFDFQEAVEICRLIERSVPTLLRILSAKIFDECVELV